MIPKKEYDIGIVGGGAAGMMAALSAAEAGASVVIYEKMNALGKKLRITGKGRCNVTNNCTRDEFMASVPRNGRFLFGAYSKFSSQDTMDYFESLGVKLKTERGRRVFPVSDKAADIVYALKDEIKKYSIDVLYETTVKAVEPDNEVGLVNVITEDRNGVKEDNAHKAVIIATGGLSYPLTGSTGDGYRFASKLGANVTPLRPSLIPIETKEDYSAMSGLSLKNVTLSVKYNNKTVYSEMGEMLFTHFGVSGPLVLSASANMQEHNVPEYSMSIDLKPAIPNDELDRRILSDFGKYSGRDFINSLNDLLPQKLIENVVERSGVDPHKKISSVTKAERAALVDVLKNYRITPVRFRPIDEAIITSGGIDVSEISPKTMELKKAPNVYVCGEIIDCDAYTGGYNLQIAFCTARLAGASAAETVIY